LGNRQWHKTFGGSNDDYGESVNQTSDLGFIITGYTESYGAGGRDVWLIKTDSFGNEQWNKTFGGSNGDEGYSVWQTSDGGYIITGDTYSYGPGGSDVWLIKTNSSGDYQWDTTIGTGGDDHGRSVQQTSDGGYIIAGREYSFAIFSWNVWLIKTNSSGDVKWYKTFGGDSADYGESVQQTSDGGYIITGWTSSYSAEYSDVWLIKTNASGNKEWNKTFSRGWFEKGYSVQQTTDGGYIIAGFSQGADESDVWLIKTSSSGNWQWGREIGISGDDMAYSVRQADDGGYIIAGYTESYGAGDSDVWLIKTDSSGNCNPIGNLNSVNLLSGENPHSINTFNYTVSIPSGTNISVQFSQDNLSWYGSSGVENGWDILSDGSGSIDLSALGWQGSDFYYKMNFTSDYTYDTKIPALKNINISYSRYVSLGKLESQPYDSSEDNTVWKTLDWTATTDPDTSIAFQLRTAALESELLSEDFVGPDGLTDTYYTIFGQSIWEGHNDNRWIQYKAYLSTQDTSKTPILHDVTITYEIDATPPAAITDLVTSNPTSVSITTTWTAPGDDGDIGNAIGYVVKYSSSGVITEANWASTTDYTQSWTPLSPGSTENYVISGLSPGTQYWFAIKAYDDVPNHADISNSPSSTTISGPTFPEAPTILTATPGDGYVNLTWNTPVSDGGSQIISYTIYRGMTSEDVSPLIIIGNITYYNDTSITNDQTYYYKVCANNSVGEGPLSDEISATPGTGVSLNPPSLIDPGTEDHDGIYYVNWSSVAGATSYVLEEDDNSGFTYPTESYSGSGISYQVTSKAKGTYYYRVKATTSGMESSWSNIESITVNITDDDEDGLPDSWEQNRFGNLDQGPGDDFDGDGYSNLEEYQADSNPTDSKMTPIDIDGDGLPDIWEQNHFGNLDQGPGDDFDGDEYSNLEEYQAGSDPVDPQITPEDNDGDGLLDSWEQNYFGNLDQGPQDDYDGDGHTNLEEYQEKTSPIDVNDPFVAADGEEEQKWWLWIVIAIVIAVIVIISLISYLILSKRKKQPPIQQSEPDEEVAFEEIEKESQEPSDEEVSFEEIEEESQSPSEDEITFDEIVGDKAEGIKPPPPPPQ
jgi:hypothetical protein